MNINLNIPIMAQENGLPFKLVYQDWFIADGVRLPAPNTLHPLVVKQLFDNYDSKNGLRTPKSEEQFQRNNSGYYFRHSNLLGYVERFYGFPDSFVSVDQVTDDCTYYYPIEIEWSGLEYLSNTSTFTYEGNDYQYKFEDCIDVAVLNLMREGKINILVSNFIDPAPPYGYVVSLTQKFKDMGIKPENVYFLFGNVPSQFEHDKDKLGCNVKSAILSIIQAAKTLGEFPNNFGLNYISDNVKPNDFLNNKIRSKKFICFNRTMDRDHRVALFYLALKYNLLSCGIFSFLNRFDPVRPNNLVSDDNWESYVKKMSRLVPYEIDTQYLSMEEKESFQTVGLNKKEFYLDSYIHIVSETSFNSDTDPFMSEKTWRPIMNLQPFIYVGNYGALAKLKQLGFKTFDKWIDESYDNVIDPKQRFDLITTEILKINNMSIQQIHDMYYEMVNVLIYNQELLKTFKNYNFLEDFFKWK